MQRSEGEIAIAVPLGVPHLERVVHGVRAYAQEKTDWRFLLSPETHRLSPTALKEWSGQGVIAIVNTQEDVEVLQSLDCPVVNVSGALKDTPFPRVRPDYKSIEKSCADFLLTYALREYVDADPQSQVVSPLVCECSNKLLGTTRAWEVFPFQVFVRLSRSSVLSKNIVSRACYLRVPTF